VQPQEGEPDFLLYELVVDACARAKRFDLVMNVLWPEYNRLNMVVTPALFFSLTKVGCLAGETDWAAALVQSAIADQQPPVARDHFVAVISGYLAEEQWRSAYKWFNKMKRAGFAADPQLYSLLFSRLTAAQVATKSATLREDIHYIWTAIVRSPSFVVPRWLYTQIICSLAASGNIPDMLEAAERMNRRADAAGAPEALALSAMFDALVAAGMQREATDVLYQLKAQAAAGLAASELNIAGDAASASSIILATVSAKDAVNQYYKTKTVPRIIAPVPSQLMQADSIAVPNEKGSAAWLRGVAGAADTESQAAIAAGILREVPGEGAIEQAGDDSALEAKPGNSYLTYGSRNVLNGTSITARSIIVAVEANASIIPLSALEGILAAMPVERAFESLKGMLKRIEGTVTKNFQQGGDGGSSASFSRAASSSDDSSDEAAGAESRADAAAYKNELGANRELSLGVDDDGVDDTAASIAKGAGSATKRAARKLGRRTTGSASGVADRAAGSRPTGTGSTSPLQ
jgi:pentatricopeptide repeat protein